MSASRLPLVTERLCLRDARADDFAAVHRYASDPEVTRFMLWGPNGAEATQEFLERTLAAANTQPRSDFGLLVEERAKGAVIGGCGSLLTPKRATRNQPPSASAAARPPT